MGTANTYVIHLKYDIEIDELDSILGQIFGEDNYSIYTKAIVNNDKINIEEIEPIYETIQESDIEYINELPEDLEIDLGVDYDNMTIEEIEEYLQNARLEMEN